MVDSERSSKSSFDKTQGSSSSGPRRKVDSGITSDHDSDDCIPKDLKKKKPTPRKVTAALRKSKTPEEIIISEDTGHDVPPSDIVGMTELRKPTKQPNYAMEPFLPNTQSTTTNSPASDPVPQRPSTPLFLSQHSRDTTPQRALWNTAPKASGEREKNEQDTPQRRNRELPEYFPPATPLDIGNSILRKKRSPSSSPRKSTNELLPNSAVATMQAPVTSSGT